jgi:hypothetical protein
MHVVRHDNVATNRPTMTFAHTLPFFDQHAGSGFMGENVSPISCAYCDEINWGFDPARVRRRRCSCTNENLDTVVGSRQRAAADGSGYSQDCGRRLRAIGSFVLAARRCGSSRLRNVFVRAPRPLPASTAIHTAAGPLLDNSAQNHSPLRGYQSSPASSVVRLRQGDHRESRCRP